MVNATILIYLGANLEICRSYKMLKNLAELKESECAVPKPVLLKNQAGLL